MTNKRRQIRWTDQEERKRILESYSWNRPGAEERLLADNASFSSSSSSNLLADTACNVALGNNETNSHTHMLNLMLMMTLMMMVVVI